MPNEKITLLGFIVKKEATGISVFGDKGDRVIGGNIGDAVIKDEKGEIKVIKPDVYETLKAKTKKVQSQGETNV